MPVRSRSRHQRAWAGSVGRGWMLCETTRGAHQISAGASGCRRMAVCRASPHEMRGPQTVARVHERGGGLHALGYQEQASTFEIESGFIVDKLIPLQQVAR
jgi:hypothetical protein